MNKENEINNKDIIKYDKNAIIVTEKLKNNVYFLSYSNILKTLIFIIGGRTN